MLADERDDRSSASGEHSWEDSMIDRRQLVASVTGTMTLAFPSLTWAQTSWDMPTPYTDGTFHTENLRWFIDETGKATKNDIRIQVHSNNSLIRGPEILRAVSSGQVAAGEILLSQFGNEDPILELDAIPFLTNSAEQAMALYQASKSALEESLLKRNVRMLYCVAWPSQAFFSKAPINAVADMSGMRFRTGSPMTSRMAELLGAVPTVVQGSEIPQAFATGIVSGMVTSAATGVQSRAWEFSTYLTNMRAFMPKNAIIVNERAWQRLPDAVRNAMTSQAALAEQRGWELSAKAETEAVEELRKNGMTVVEPSASLAADARQIGGKLSEEWIKKSGATGRQIIRTYWSRIKS
jgi:TRAP-type C4-dicarboxylate transport system substrate-binding protein